MAEFLGYTVLLVNKMIEMKRKKTYFVTYYMIRVLTINVYQVHNVIINVHKLYELYMYIYFKL